MTDRLADLKWARSEQPPTEPEAENPPVAWYVFAVQYAHTPSPIGQDNNLKYVIADSIEKAVELVKKRVPGVIVVGVNCLCQIDYSQPILAEFIGAGMGGCIGHVSALAKADFS